MASKQRRRKVAPARVGAGDHDHRERLRESVRAVERHFVLLEDKDTCAFVLRTLKDGQWWSVQWLAEASEGIFQRRSIQYAVASLFDRGLIEARPAKVKGVGRAVTLYRSKR